MFKWLWGHKDGGPESEVQCWGLEIKSLFSVMILRFTKESRPVYHAHAFDCISWVLSGALHEDELLPGGKHKYRTYAAGLRPVVIYKTTVHQVRGSRKPNWALTFRGPWNDTWGESMQDGSTRTLTHGRRVV